MVSFSCYESHLRNASYRPSQTSRRIPVHQPKMSVPRPRRFPGGLLLRLAALPFLPGRPGATSVRRGGVATRRDVYPGGDRAGLRTLGAQPVPLVETLRRGRTGGAQGPGAIRSPAGSRQGTALVPSPLVQEGPLQSGDGAADRRERGNRPEGTEAPGALASRPGHDGGTRLWRGFGAGPRGRRRRAA